MTELTESNQLLSLLESKPTSILEIKNRAFLNLSGANASELVLVLLLHMKVYIKFNSQEKQSSALMNEASVAPYLLHL